MLSSGPVLKQSPGFQTFFDSLSRTCQVCMLSPLGFILYINELINMCIDSNIPDIFIDNRTNSKIPGDVLSINILMHMYAGDICAINDTIDRNTVSNEYSFNLSAINMGSQ